MVSLLERLRLDQRGFPRRLIGSEKGECLIIGTARCVWNDVNGLPETPNVMCVGRMGMYWPGRFKHWYSNVIEQLPHWSEGRQKRLNERFGKGWRLHSACYREEWKDVVHHWPLPCQGGSGLVAILVTLLLGYDDVTVAGMPFNNSGHFFDPPQEHNLRKDREWSNFINETPDSILERHIPLWDGKVRFLSGRGKELLGG